MSIPVLLEDQQRINKFSRLNTRFERVEEELERRKVDFSPRRSSIDNLSLQKDAENLKDAVSDIDSLLDDDACKSADGSLKFKLINIFHQNPNRRSFLPGQQRDCWRTRPGTTERSSPTT